VKLQRQGQRKQRQTKKIRKINRKDKEGKIVKTKNEMYRDINNKVTGITKVNKENGERKAKFKKI
jgi:hypothetical protein